METLNIEAEVRTESGKKSAQALRREGKVPAVLYHKGDENITVAIKEGALRKLIYTSESHIVNLKLSNGKEEQCVLKATTFDPVTEKPLHLDFVGLRANETVDVEVPTMLTGTSPGILKGGRIQVILHKALVRCLPADIPEHITVDMSKVDLNESFHIGDVKLDKVKLLGNPKLPIVSVVTLTKEEVAAPVAVATDAKAEPEVIAKGKKEDAAAAADPKAAGAKVPAAAAPAKKK
jgi:large subunit ribosomal protein L25